MLNKNQILVFIVSFLIAGFFLLSTAEVGFCQGPIGACCAFGVCEVVTPADCAANGGVYQGDSSNCNPPTCQGACCLPTGVCVEVIADECGGEFQGLDTLCSSTMCPTPPPSIPTLNQWGMIIMAGVLGLFAVIALFVIRRGSVVKAGS